MTHNNQNDGDQEVIWCWEETRSEMFQHGEASIFRDGPAGNWIKYDQQATMNLEAAFREQDQRVKCDPLTGYTVDFSTMQQTNLSTGFQRMVLRWDGKVWCWKETQTEMSRYKPAEIFGDTTDCWIIYDRVAMAKLERSYLALERVRKCSPIEGYTVDVPTMKQTNISTGYARNVGRFKKPWSFKVWCWKETPSQMPLHTAAEIFDDPVDCWIRYGSAASAMLERAYRAQKQIRTCEVMDGYTVDLATMKQTNIITRFQRDVMRAPIRVATIPTTIDSSVNPVPVGLSTPIQVAPNVASANSVPVAVVTSIQASPNAVSDNNVPVAVATPVQTSPYEAAVNPIPVAVAFIQAEPHGAQHPYPIAPVIEV